MAHTIIHDIGVASQIGSYSDAIEAKANLRWLMTSGMPGLTVNGDGFPKTLPARPNSRGNILSGQSWERPGMTGY